MRYCGSAVGVIFMLRRNYLSEVRWLTGLGRRFLCCVAGSMHAVSLTLFSRLDRKVVYQLREIGAMTVLQKKGVRAS